ncbi:cytochrome P450 3A6-like [Patiria miniata]|uniref:Thromboxane-A synthase n=1 Tax=Patiria miniata TaxID=46514 RepID=A0A914BM37_PATMI|nr:cytochrome P450 3A6-like [Patiria miniata]
MGLLEFFTLTPVTVKLLVATAALFLIYDWWCHQYFQKHGIPVDRYFPIIGSPMFLKKGIGYKFVEYQKKYGRIFGSYFFRTPMICITDVDFLKQIMVKNFSHFVNRRSTLLSRKPMKRGLLGLKDDDWKTVRSVVTPAFSASKMKQMSSMINECCDTLVTNFEKMAKEGKPVNCKTLYGGFTMDSIAWCGFGLKVDSLSSEHNEFVEHARLAFSFRRSALLLFITFVPFLNPILEYFDVALMPAEVATFFTHVTDEARRLRNKERHQGADQNGHNKNIDTLQLLLNAHNETAEDEENEAGPQLNTSKVVKRPLTKDEVTAQGITFFLAGYETTNTLLGFASYLLALNQDCQEKLYSEILDVAPSRELVSYDTVGKMNYLDMVISESLRYYPPVAGFFRTCNKTFTYDGTTIEKGRSVLIHVYAMHHDEKYWPNPEKFDPERFSPERKSTIHPMAYLPFGFGPRSCIGMRFALLEAKMALVRVLQQYRLDVGPETQIPMKLHGGIFTAPREGIQLRPVPRQ